MAYRDQVKQSATVNGTGAFTLGAAVSGFQTMNTGRAVGATVEYRFSKDGQFEAGIGTIAAGNTLSRAPTASSNGGALVNFTAGSGEIVETAIAQSLNDFGRISTGLNIGDLAVAGSIPDTYVLEVFDPATGTNLKATVAALRSIFGGTGTAPGDTTAPVMAGSLTSSNVSTGGFTVSWSAATDAVGVTGYEISKDSGSTWTNIGNVLTYTFTGLTAGTAYPVRLLAYDAAGNRPTTTLGLTVTTSAAGGNAAPTMSGSMTFTNITTSGYTANWTAGSDDTAVAGYDFSTDGGATWTQLGNVLTYAVTGAQSNTTYNPRVRARDAAGLTSNVITAPVTTAAAAVVAYTITPYAGYATLPPSTFSLAAKTPTYNYNSTGGPRIFDTGATSSGYWNVKTSTNTNAPGCAIGWSTSPTVPPSVWDGTGTNPTLNGANATNSACRVTHNGNAFPNVSSLVIPNGFLGKMYLHFKPDDGAWQCINSSGMDVTA